MEYIYSASDRYNKELKNNEYSCLAYFSKKAIKKEYPRGGYVVVGGIGRGLKNKYDDFLYGEEKCPFYTLHYPKLRYGIDGYFHVGNDQYIAVVKNRLFRNLIIALFIIAAITAAIIGGRALLGDNGLDPSAKDFTPSNDLTVNTDPDHISLPGYDSVTLQAGTDTAYVALWNPPKNPCYFKFSIILDEETLYETGLIEPGKAVTEIKLNRTFEAGTYPIQIKIDTFDLGDKDTPLNGGLIETNLVAVE